VDATYSLEGYPKSGLSGPHLVSASGKCGFTMASAIIRDAYKSFVEDSLKALASELKLTDY
jgi:hypothetical protein